jgi:head-tail adaptor
MGLIGSLARETFTIDISGTFMANFVGEPLRDGNGNPLAYLNVADDGWSETPEWVIWREEINGEFKWLTSGSEDGKADKETMIRTATLRVRKMEVEGLRSEMRVKRLCDDKYFNITQYYDDPVNGLYMNINLRAIDD